MNKRWKKNREVGFLIYDLVKMMLCSMACGVDGDRKRLSKEGIPLFIVIIKYNTF